ncbi:MAG: DNA-directed polymerase, beta subunit, partial [Parcubacteria group bacterium]|nr:DNA-directed polymerase, beta subunit [Parcubacteria group bacterium]
MPKTTPLVQKTFKAFRAPLVEFPDLVGHQRESFQWLLKDGLMELFKEFSPIPDYSGKKFELRIDDFEIGDPKGTEEEARENMRTYEAPLKATVTLLNKTMGTEKTQDIFLADIPMMTPHGSFIVSGVERAIVPQLARSFGAFFISEESKGKQLFGAKIIPSRGVWIEIDSESDGAIYVKIDRKRKFPVTNLLAILGAGTREEILKKFIGNDIATAAVSTTLSHDTAMTIDEAYVEIHRRMRDGDLATPDNAKSYVNALFTPERYDLSKVGRHRLNARFGRPVDAKSLAKERTLTLEDLIRIVGEIARLNTDPNAKVDDIDHLGFRRVRFVGELLQARMRVGMSRMKRNIQDRMSTIESETSLPMAFVNPRPFQASVREFYTANQLSQFMDQQNILAELENMRTLSALGPGGLTRERAGFEVRDVHPSHYGRICPIETPEGPNIGLINSMCTYARINEFGFIETPYRKVKGSKVTIEIEYLTADQEEKFLIAQANNPIDKTGKFLNEKVTAREAGGEFIEVDPSQVNYMDVSPKQLVSVAAGLIPFLEHDDANRALMGSNMQRQGVPLLVSESPYVGTGLEGKTARDSRSVIVSEMDGIIAAATAEMIVTTPDGKLPVADEKFLSDP